MESIASRPLEHATLHVRGVLFDMDGVLIDSTGSDERCWLRWARLHNMEGTFSLHATHGRRAIDTIRALRPDLDPEVELRHLEEFGAEDQNGFAALPGVGSLLAALPPNSWTIVTSASERLMRNRLQFTGIAVPQNIISADHVSHGKPHPEPYERGARILCLPPSECLVIEDAPNGIKAGKAAGCKVLAVLSSHKADDLAEADWIVPSLDHVVATPIPDGAIAIHWNIVKEGSS